MIRRMMLALGLAALLAVVVKTAMPDIQRYLKIRAM
jgi:hypothetical protein